VAKQLSTELGNIGLLQKANYLFAKLCGDMGSEHDYLLVFQRFFELSEELLS
jgi:hypothetical protein